MRWFPIFFFYIACIAPCIVSAQILSILPTTIIQGDPVFITIDAPIVAQSIRFAGNDVPLFLYAGKQRAFIPIDIARKPGQYPLILSFENSTSYTEMITVGPRHMLEAPLGIPTKLGGNTNAAATVVVDSLEAENTILAKLWSGTKAFWSKPFVAPLSSTTVTDAYGYNRKTGEYTIPHKGTDFRAAVGTPVLAMNRGVVRLTRNWKIYGKTIVVDHGLGLQTLYMHLSKIYVDEGELVTPGEIIGLSGDTGYADMPHLHVSVKLSRVSIDPVVFLSIFTMSR